MEVHGYSQCGCGELFVADGHRQCGACRKRVAVEAVERVNVLVAGHVVSVGGPRRKRERHRGGRKSAERTKAYHRARRLAISRLIALYPELFEAMLDEELCALGEPPVRINRLSASRRLLSRVR